MVTSPLHLTILDEKQLKRRVNFDTGTADRSGRLLATSHA